MDLSTGLLWIKIYLRGYGNTQPSKTQFIDILNVESKNDIFIKPSLHEWESELIGLLNININDFQSFPEPYEGFTLRLKEEFLKSAEWLNTQNPISFDQIRKLGFKTDIVIEGWLMNEQFDLEIPLEFISACAKLGLTITIITND